MLYKCRVCGEEFHEYRDAVDHAAFVHGVIQRIDETSDEVLRDCSDAILAYRMANSSLEKIEQLERWKRESEELVRGGYGHTVVKAWNDIDLFKPAWVIKSDEDAKIIQAAFAYEKVVTKARRMKAGAIYTVEAVCSECSRPMLIRRVEGGGQLDVRLCERCRQERPDLRAEAVAMEQRALASTEYEGYE